jgi:hypothetical protein
MNLLKTLLFFFIAATSAYSGALPDDPRAFPVLILHQAGSGSGCIIQLSNSVYFVTAKHVLFADQAGTNPPTLLSATALLKGYQQITRTNGLERTLVLNLSKLMQAGEIRYSTNRDVAIVRIYECLTNNLAVRYVIDGVSVPPGQDGLISELPSSMVCPMKDIDVSSEVFMFGYPISLTGPISSIFDPTEPLLRRGIVAGINQEKQTVIIDSASYQGNSGGPVIEVDHPSVEVTSFRVIGLVHGFVPFEEEWENKTFHYSHSLMSNSGYTIIEPMDGVLNLIWK